jgi:hypothetical protein
MDREFIAGELVKVARDLVATRSFQIYKTTAPITYKADLSLDSGNRFLEDLLWVYEVDIQKELDRHKGNYKVHANWKAMPKVYSPPPGSTDSIVKGVIEFRVTQIRLEDSDFDRIIERAVR